VTELQREICVRVLIYLVTISTPNKMLIKTDLQLNIPLKLPMVLAAKVFLLEGQLQRLKSTCNKISKISTEHIEANSFQNNHL